MRVRIRQIVDQFMNRLFAVPMALVASGIVLAFITLEIDRNLSGSALPTSLQTTVESARAMLSTIAGGLITSVTLLLSLMLVAVQLASSQYSPRTLRNWLGDRAQQITIGVVLGTAVYCLLVLRAARTISEGVGQNQNAEELVPHIGVLVALTLGITSLVLVVRSVDHLTDSLRIGGVGQRIMARTLTTIRRQEHETETNWNAQGQNSPPLTVPDERPDAAQPIEAAKGGWIQQIDNDVLFEALPAGATCWIAAPLGSYVVPDSPLVWIDRDPAECGDGIRRAFALGDGRTMQQDVGYGIVRLSDIAVRALSPGVNDPNTATDMIAHLGVVMIRLWEQPDRPRVRSRNGRSLVWRDLRHVDHLRSAFDQIRRYGAADPTVATALISALGTLRSETLRRRLPGPLAPIDEMIGDVIASLDRDALLDRELTEIEHLADEVRLR